MTGGDWLEAEVFVYDADGVQTGYSPSLNSTISLTIPGMHTILIQGDG